MLDLKDYDGKPVEELVAALNEEAKKFDQEMENQSPAMLKTKEELADFIEQCITDDLTSNEKADWIINMLVGDGLITINGK